MISPSVCIVAMLLMFVFGAIAGWRARGIHEGSR